MQGMTATPGLVAHWVLPARVAEDIKWFICYVTLSRVPSLKQLVSIGLSDKIREVLESGPPEGLVQMFSTLLLKKSRILDVPLYKRNNALVGERPREHCLLKIKHSRRVALQAKQLLVHLSRLRR